MMRGNKDHSHNRRTVRTGATQDVPERAVTPPMARLIRRVPGLERALLISRRVWPSITVFRKTDGTFACELDARLPRKEPEM